LDIKIDQQENLPILMSHDTLLSVNVAADKIGGL